MAVRLSFYRNRPFPHYAPVSKHKDMRTRLGWTISYKSLYFVHPSLELVPLFKGMRERSIVITFQSFFPEFERRVSVSLEHTSDKPPMRYFSLGQERIKRSFNPLFC